MKHKLTHIVEGNVKNVLGVKTINSEFRKEICLNCPFIKDSILGMFCSKCGCLINAKVLVEDEHCDLKKW